jgi:hypothetical protein
MSKALELIAIRGQGTIVRPGHHFPTDAACANVTNRHLGSTGQSLRRRAPMRWQLEQWRQQWQWQQRRQQWPEQWQRSSRAV